MKTITASFLISGKKIGSVTGEFYQFPGPGNLHWENTRELLNYLPKGTRLWNQWEAEGFAALCLHFANLLGGEWKMTESGTWEDIPQDDLIIH